MYLGSYDFDGDPAALMPAYEQLLSQYPPGSLELHICVVREGGLTVYDACPSRQQFADFSGSPEFAAGVAAAGLPAPRVTPVGQVHLALVGEGARS